MVEHSRLPDEDERLFTADTRFKVLMREEREGKVWIKLEEVENDPETDPALLEDRTMETYQAMEEKDAKAWERRHRR